MDVLIFVDCQFDFLRPEGKLHVKGSEDIRDNLGKLLGEINAKWNYDTERVIRPMAYEYIPRVVYTVDWHEKDDLEISITPGCCPNLPRGVLI